MKILTVDQIILIAFCIALTGCIILQYVILGAYNSVSDELVGIVRDAKDLLLSLVHEYEAPNSYRTEQVSYGGRGRPKFDVQRDQLEF